MNVHERNRRKKQQRTEKNKEREGEKTDGLVCGTGRGHEPGQEVITIDLAVIHDGDVQYTIYKSGTLPAAIVCPMVRRVFGWLN